MLFAIGDVATGLPNMKVTRGADPGPLSPYGRYKPHLQRVFCNRCAYCRTVEVMLGGYDAMTIDHFRPRGVKRYAHLVERWANLYYACAVCNRRKHKSWPSRAEATRGEVFVDCCRDDPNNHIRIGTSGPMPGRSAVVSLTSAGAFSIKTIKLNRDQLLRMRSDLFGEVLKTRRLIDEVAFVLGLASGGDQKAALVRVRDGLLSQLQELEGRYPFRFL
jgi:uncharacterized protein (TIGR02646 family)